MDDPNRQTSYFNYFSEIEEHFQRRWGGILRFSPLDWALVETWKEAGIPLQAVLRGIDVTFEHYERRRSKTRKVNGLGFCAQEVLAAAEDMKEAAVGASAEELQSGKKDRVSQGFEPDRTAAYLRRNADLLATVEFPEKAGITIRTVAQQAMKSLRELAEDTERNSAPRLEDLERRLTVMEEKILAALLTSTPDEEIVAIRAEADRDLAPYRRRMSAAQIEPLHKQYIHKRLLERYKLPRLSLFYM
jgi:hypothetical protein